MSAEILKGTASAGNSKKHKLFSIRPNSNLGLLFFIVTSLASLTEIHIAHCLVRQTYTQLSPPLDLAMHICNTCVCTKVVYKNRFSISYLI